jgi:hypothetical protein
MGGLTNRSRSNNVIKSSFLCGSYFLKLKKVKKSIKINFFPQNGLKWVSKYTKLDADVKNLNLPKRQTAKKAMTTRNFKDL